MGNWGEDFLEKTFNINYDEMRALLLYQYLVETREKADKSNTKGKKESTASYANSLYKDLLAPTVRYRETIWRRSIIKCLSSLDKDEIGKELEGKSIFDTKLYTNGLSRYYECLLFVACLFELNRCSEKDIPKFRLVTSYPYDIIIRSYLKLISPSSKRARSVAAFQENHANRVTERLITYLFKDCKDINEYHCVYHFLVKTRVFMHSVKNKDNEKNYLETISLNIAYLCSERFYGNNDYTNAIRFSSLVLRTDDAEYRKKAFDIIGTSAFESKQYQLAYDIYSCWVNSELIESIKEPCLLNDEDFRNLRKSLKSKKESVYRSKNEQEVSRIYSYYARICIEVMDLLRPSLERESLLEIAKFYLDEAARLYPDDDEHLKIKGIMLIKNKEYGEAQKCFKSYVDCCYSSEDIAFGLRHILLTYQNRNLRYLPKKFDDFADKYVDAYREMLRVDYEHGEVQKGRDMYVLLTKCSQLSEQNKGLNFDLFKIDRTIKEILDYLKRTPKFFASFNVHAELFCDELKMAIKSIDIKSIKKVEHEEDDSTIAYYTTLNTLEYLLKETTFGEKKDDSEDKESKEGIKLNSLTMMHARYMNDPEEGLILFKHLHKLDCFSETPNELRDMLYDQKYVFLKSFTGIVDQLNMWTLYGSDRESGDDCNGCCVCLKPETFGPASNYSNKLDSSKSSHTEDDFNLYNVAYIDKKGIMFKGKYDNDLNTKFNNLINQIKNLKSKIEGDDEVKKKDEGIITDCLVRLLEKLVFLVKDSTYIQEGESRLILSRDISDRLEIREIPKPADKPNVPPKLYMNPPFQVYVEKIYLGPKLENPDYWIPHLQMELSKMHDKWVYGEERDYIPQVRLSEINIR
ncbi:MAG: hypothetical protein IJK83_12725 [Clostridiales bacterium]|nr:hypothetical protein [Clostridiales bacterium]